MSLKVQKKLVSKMSSKQLVKSIIDDSSGKVLDGIHDALKQYKSGKEADKVLKYLIKSVLKIVILQRNDQFSQKELNFLEDFSTKFKLVISKTVEFYKDPSTYDKYFLQNLFEECRILSQSIVQRHLTTKSKNGIDLVFNTFAEQDLLDAMFTNEAYKGPMDKIIAGLS